MDQGHMSIHDLSDGGWRRYDSTGYSSEHLATIDLLCRRKKGLATALLHERSIHPSTRERMICHDLLANSFFPTIYPLT